VRQEIICLDGVPSSSVCSVDALASEVSIIVAGVVWSFSIPDSVLSSECASSALGSRSIVDVDVKFTHVRWLPESEFCHVRWWGVEENLQQKPPPVQ